MRAHDVRHRAARQIIFVCMRKCARRAPSPVFLMSAPGRPSLVSSSRSRMRGAERRQTRRIASPPERLARPPETRGVSFLLAIGGRRLPALHCAAFCVPLSRASGRRQVPPVGPRSGAVATAPSSPPRAAPDMGRPVLMPADGWPEPPGGGVTSPARGRRINESGFPASSGEQQGRISGLILTAAPSSARLR